MKHENIERNKLDYILSDLLPLEISELFSLTGFYNYLLINQKKINKSISKLRDSRENNNKKMFEAKGWASAPLKYNILKGCDGQRTMSIIQPISMINIYLFLELYQKQILILLQENSVFSIRYHKKNNDLYYKKKVKKISEYYYKTSEKVDRGVLQQMGIYFKISPFNSVSTFTGSRIWQQQNFKYSNYARLDYKSCFDSIYTHVYKWISQKNVVDSKAASNSSLYITIDKVLQNINSKSSNGVVVGPEFSRMIVELLLQHIDVEIYSKLSIKGYEKDKHYNIYRYVDDMFVFAESESTINEVISVITEISENYLIRPNEMKTFKSKTPFITNNWIVKTREIADKIAELFNNVKDLKTEELDKRNLLKDGYLHFAQIKEMFNNVICEFPDEKRTVVSYCLSTLLNNVNKKKDGLRIVSDKAPYKAFHLLELALYIFAYCPCFEHTQKVISIIVYLDDELKFKENQEMHIKLQGILSNYMFIFIRGNLNDLCNLLVVFNEFNITLPTEYEDIVFSRIKEHNNPILLANYLIYSNYYKGYFDKVAECVKDIILSKIDGITKNEEILQEEFWYIIIFINCPYLSEDVIRKMVNVVEDMKSANNSEAVCDEMNLLVCDYLLKREENQFFKWDVHHISTSKQIAFRTYQRSIFREYRKRNSMLYGSID